MNWNNPKLNEMQTEFENMNRKVKDIPISEVFKIYDKIPKRYKLDSAKQLGLINCSKLCSIEYVTSYQFNKFLYWAKRHDFLSPNKIANYVPFNSYEVQPHIKEVLNLINSPDYVLLNKKDRFRLTYYYNTKIAELSKQDINQ
jgi:hypothetical protein